MTPQDLVEIIKIIGPAFAAYVSVRVGIAVAMEKADAAEKTATRAHVRIDELMQIKRH
jgi:hypothetical protein